MKTQVKKSGIQKYLRQCAERKKMGVLTTGYLMVNSWTDWRRKKWRLGGRGSFVLTAFIYVGTDQKLCWSGLLPGICLWLASLWRSDQIGSGDGIVLMGIGWIRNTAGMCDFFRQRSFWRQRLGSACWHWEWEEKELPFVPFYGRISSAVYLRTGKQMKRFVNIQKRS